MMPGTFKMLIIAVVTVSSHPSVQAWQKDSSSLHSSSNQGQVSLYELTVPKLRERQFGSRLEPVVLLGSYRGESDYSKIYSSDGSAPYNSYLAAYRSDGLRLYTRVDIPASPAPANGYPVLIFTHGYVGIAEAPNFHFSYTDKSMYAELIDAYVDAGFVVLTPGYRGHGVANGIQADGIDYMEKWDNGSYVSPIFYAIDVLNLLDGVQSLEALEWPGKQDKITVNLERISLAGHSQGGDVALNVLAVAGEGSKVKNKIRSASIWSGTFPDRMTQAETYYPMQSTPEAFTGGDGKWTGTAAGTDGSFNPNFIFAYPSDWIETPHVKDWTWQKKTWFRTNVGDALVVKFDEMYDALINYTTDVDKPQYHISKNADGKTTISHDPTVLNLMNSLGAFQHAQYLTEPLNLHVPDQDFYSLPEWNENLCKRVDAANGDCRLYIYPQNNHGLRLSSHAWFSGPAAPEGYRLMIERDIRHFRQ